MEGKSTGLSNEEISKIASKLQRDGAIEFVKSYLGKNNVAEITVRWGTKTYIEWEGSDGTSGSFCI